MGYLVFVLKFIAYGLYFGIATLLWIPIILFRLRDPCLFRDFITPMSSVGLRVFGVKIKLKGLSKRDVNKIQPCVFVSNHQSGLDILVFPPLAFDRTVAVGKQELIYIPFLGFMFWAMGNILIKRQKKREAKAKLHEAVQAIRERKISIMVLPEGTRSRDGKSMLPFKKGAFHLAVDAQVPIVPLVASSYTQVMNLKSGYVFGGELTVSTLPPISTEGLTSDDVDELTERVRNIMLKEFYEISGLPDPHSAR